MLVVGFPAQAFSTNCWVVALAAGEQCVVVDPGVGVEARLDEVLREHRLQPVAVLLTHGHLDHTFSVAPVCGARGVPAYIHPADRELLADPVRGLSPESRQLFGGRLEWTEPDDVAVLDDGARLQLAGLELTVAHAPGHTPGSVLLHLPGAQDRPPVCLSGDVLFAGSIGRTDLPGGSDEQMRHSLTTRVLPLDDDVVVHPGHGPSTTIGRERATNPWLADLAPGTGARRGL